MATGRTDPTQPRNRKPQEAVTPNDSAETSPRLQSLMADLGIASRRGSAQLVQEGRVKVDGQQVYEPGFRVANPSTAVITVNGINHSMRGRALKTTTIMLNKPRGLVCSSDDAHEPTVFECLRGIRARLVCAGRLDKNSEGLLILSDDGDLINRLTHPRFGHKKEYLATVRGNISQAVLDFLNSPIRMDGYTTQPARVEYVKRISTDYHGARHQLKFVLAEGRNRQIRNMCEQADLNVVRLVRVAINKLRLPSDLQPGSWRFLDSRDFSALERIP